MYDGLTDSAGEQEPGTYRTPVIAVCASVHQDSDVAVVYSWSRFSTKCKTFGSVINKRRQCKFLFLFLRWGCVQSAKLLLPVENVTSWYVLRYFLVSLFCCTFPVGWPDSSTNQWRIQGGGWGGCIPPTSQSQEWGVEWTAVCAGCCCSTEPISEMGQWCEGATWVSRYELIGKRVTGLPIIVWIELFSLGVTAKALIALYERLSVQNQRFRSNGARLTQNLGRMGRPQQSFFFSEN